jgi:Pentatricopeptide repeat domain
MLSWALVHSPWTTAVHIPLKFDLITRAATQLNARSKSSSLANSRPRYPRIPSDLSVFEDSSKEYVTISSNYPASRTPPTSEQTLVDFVREGKHDLANKVRQELSELGTNIQPSSVYEAVVEDMLQNRNTLSTSALQNWLALLPDAKDPSTNSFIRIRKLLLASPKENLPLIKQFGRICSSKGYSYILENDILPIVSRLSSPQAHVTFVEELQIEANACRGKTTDLFQPKQANSSQGSAVFENELDEYDVVNSESTPHPPSILSLIEESLPNLLPPPQRHDQLVFEDASNPEYALYSSASPSYIPNSLINNLHSLIKGERCDEALRIFNEIRDLDIPIPAHWIYLKAARAVLRSSNNSAPLSQEQVDTFTSWCLLIPPIHHTSVPTNFVRMWGLILYAPIVNVALAIRFAIILASKGYGHHVVHEALPSIVRFFPGDVCHRFIVQFEKTNEQFWRESNPKLADFKIVKLTALTREVAVKNLISSSRFEEAIGLIPDIRSNAFPLTRSTFNLLLLRLETSSNRAVKQYIPMVKALRTHRIPVFRRNVYDEYTSMAVNKGSTFGIQPVADAEVHTNISEHLKKAVASRDGGFPHPDTLVNFMEKCSENGETKAFLALRNTAFSAGFSNASDFIFAEMLYYLRRGWDDLVIQTFVDYFFTSGVPQDEVAAHYDRVQQIQAPADGRDDGHKRPTRFPFERNLNFGKIWPTQAHCSLVWHSLVHLAPDSAAIERLYEKLVRLGLYGTDSLQVPTSISNPSHIPLTWERNVGEAFFTPFIRPLMVAFGAARGSMVLADMLKVGVEPSVYHYTELAGQYARTGDIQRAFQVLGHMEATLEKNASAQPLSQAGSSPSPSLPPPDVVMYISVLAGFIISKNVEAAEEVARRLHQRHIHHVPGEIRELDEVLHRLHLLRTKHGLPVCPPMF